MKYKISLLLLIWLELRELTIEKERYTIENMLTFFIRKKGVVRLTNGYKIPYNRKNKQNITKIILLALRTGIRFGDLQWQWKLDVENEIIETHQGIRLSIDRAGLLDETFLYQIHFSGFDLKNKIIITAGSYIGDTPLFYSMYGAKVYGFEPDPNSYNLSLENIKLNPKLSKNIIIKNYALGNNGEVEFPLVPYGSEGSSVYSGHNNYSTIKVESKNISTILKEFNISDPYLLDLDIKGSEFELIEDSSIQKFQRVRIEYSPYLINSGEKNLEYLINKLQTYGFNKVRIFKHNVIRADLKNHGTIEAEK